MANPQLENGYTKIANEIMEALAKTNMSAYQSRCVLFLLRKTYGFNRKSDHIALSQWVSGTGIRKPHVCRTLKELQQKSIITNSGNKWGFNKNYKQWNVLPIQAPVTNSGNTVTNSGNLALPNQGTTKEIKKETITKEIAYSPKFETFWGAYPKKVGKGYAFQIWKKILSPKPTLEEILQSVDSHKQSLQWKKDGGQFIPNPSTWLNQRRWEDEVPVHAQSAGRVHQTRECAKCRTGWHGMELSVDNLCERCASG